ncbi:hypothetical protein CY34DRAFT_189476 [Suillus luteus UH-Slu-Lm8-n1]|uniref:Uncharacterized protein n=1 Tax=Suillus luteus UH-Slu-Lm8-n1 TaxID=930992 RepID=A0A0D0BEH8_9AGAM|nr:hypothetical protein CY34DRAFT_189476 [Suillus luteus UH-Slu-Lm8-n1]
MKTTLIAMHLFYHPIIDCHAPLPLTFSLIDWMNLTRFYTACLFFSLKLDYQWNNTVFWDCLILNKSITQTGFISYESSLSPACYQCLPSAPRLQVAQDLLKYAEKNLFCTSDQCHAP